MSDSTKPSPQVVGGEIDKNKLLLLGLNLLNKGLKLPYAVVRPQTKATAVEKPPSQLTEKLKSSLVSPPQPAQKLSALLQEGTRKRKREDNDRGEVDKREKRCRVHSCAWPLWVTDNYYALIS